MDLSSRKITGWNMNKKMTKELCLTALKWALDFCKPSGELIYPADKGSQDVLKAYMHYLKAQNI